MRRKTLALVALGVAPLIAFTTAEARWSAPEAAAAQPDRAHPAIDDATIVAIFDAANTYDIETGSLAMKNGHSKEVRDFGAMLVRDHTNVRQQGRDLAKKLGVTPTPPKENPLAHDHEEAMARLRSLKGAAFDHAFLQHEATFHKNVIDAVQNAFLPAIQNQELKDFVTKVAPAFQAHMAGAENLDQKLFPSSAAR